MRLAALIFGGGWSSALDGIQRVRTEHYAPVGAEYETKKKYYFLIVNQIE